MKTMNGFVVGDMALRTSPVLAFELRLKGVRVGESYKVVRIIDRHIFEIQIGNDFALVASEMFQKVCFKLNSNSKTI